jgi:hypothetical protein
LNKQAPYALTSLYTDVQAVSIIPAGKKEFVLIFFCDDIQIIWGPTFCVNLEIILRDSLVDILRTPHSVSFPIY